MVGDGGKMMLFRDGQEYQGIWKGSNYSAPLQLLDANKNVIDLQPGNTFICIVGNYSTVSNNTPGVWKVDFAKP
jgi:hypothetical protein